MNDNAVIIKVLAEGGSIKLYGLKTKNGWQYSRAVMDCAGQVFSDTAIGCLIADCCSKALGDKLPSLECS
ncbi:MAG: hypothetical protein RJB68_2008, partial [Pseudomonadota bacterium]